MPTAPLTRTSNARAPREAIPVCLLAILVLGGCGAGALSAAGPVAQTTAISSTRATPSAADEAAADAAVAAKAAADKAAADAVAKAAADKAAADKAAADKAASDKAASDKAASDKVAADKAAAAPVPLAAEPPPPAAQDFANCTELNAVYPHGVGMPGAVDHVSGGKPGVTNFAVNSAVYQTNSGSDRDGDGIACEKH
ncbi:excalibur calcium-binding domain-containing protein [Lapillicoccus sp.]|uniref:excalibur calcium-binding domain-containing protein n=1 Tax=Lapillicoccus sp. TaxID=1909287 RepID=UPI0025E8E8F3|nr:excalibur calcium-binding domain-containing protein [Lapillicoccus sp.]